MVKDILQSLVMFEGCEFGTLMFVGQSLNPEGLVEGTFSAQAAGVHSIMRCAPVVVLMINQLGHFFGTEGF